MRIKFCGAARQVTGSSHLITLDSGLRILLDCGLYQGKGDRAREENKQWIFDPKSVDLMVLSHAHIDHCGRIPKLVKDGFKGSIHTTHATRSLCSIMLLDSAKIQERDAEYYNKRISKKKKRGKNRQKKKSKRIPLYNTKDVAPAMSQFVGYGYNRWHYIAKDVEVMFRDAGHILGSSNVTLRITEGNKKRIIGFTGDIGRPDRPILRDPVKMPESDYLICESTYGDKEHELPPAQSQRFLEIIKKTCVEKKGKLLVPAFSLGRTQEIVYMLDQMETAGQLPKLPIYVDSPLAVNATQVFGSHPECFDKQLSEYMLTDQDPFGFNSLNYIRSVEASKALNSSNKPCIIISASGMMNAGRIRHHLANNIENPNNTILIVGYCSPDTPGGMLRNGIEEIKLFGEVKQVLAEIEIMDSFSAHADRSEMLDFINNHKNKVKKVFLVHGDYDKQAPFKKYLQKNGFGKVEIPEPAQEFELK